MILVARHGQTNDNKNHIVQGNKPLNKLGKEQAKNLAKELKNTHFDICFCSPLRRTRQTLKYIKKYHKTMEIIYDDRLVERRYGHLVGVCYDTIAGYKEMRWNANYIMPENIEQVEDFYNRIADFYDEIISKYQNKNVLVVAHSGVARMTYFYFNGKPQNKDYTNYCIRNCETLKIELND